MTLANCLFFEHYLVAYNLEIKADRRALPPVTVRSRDHFIPQMPLRTSDVQNDIFTGFLDPENVRLAVGIAFLSVLDPNLQAITFNTAAILESNMADTGSSN